MSKIIIKMMPASMGDSFLISTTGDQKTNILLDLGYGETYKKFIKKELIEIEKNKESIDLMVFTHIDSDHIVGGLTFLAENNAGAIKTDIKEIWHNTLRHIYRGKISEGIISKNNEEIIESIQANGYRLPEDSDDRKNKDISGIQGTALGAHIVKGKYNWNSISKGQAICSDDIKEPYKINDVEIILLTPNRDRLDMLSDAWRKELIENKGFKGDIPNNEFFDDVFEMLMTNSFEPKIFRKNKLINGFTDLESFLDEEEIIDKSVTNCSSISFILKYKEKKILFMGDANPEDIYISIKEKCTCDKDGKVYFDAIKVSHHGSEGNITKKLMKLIDSNKFIISTNGKGNHGHPSIKTISKIVCRESSNPRELIFNYKEVADRFFNIEQMKKYNYIVKYNETNEIQEICI